MPTENRSSNIEMVSVPRDTIEVAVGLTRHGHKSLTDQKLDQQHAQDKLRAILAEPAQPHRPCCTIDPRDLFISLNPLGLDEKDLRKDSTGFEDPRTHGDYLLFLTGFRESHPERLNHPEPIAWMVGTAFWWTKEEAERDAEATGLPIVGLGPMTGADEAERLRDVVKHSDNQIMRQSLRISNQRTQLADRLALLREALEFIDDGVGRSDAEWRLIKKLRAALSPDGAAGASDEPYQGMPGTSFQRLNALANQGE